MNFYISDLHFGHTNILSFDNRPFDTVEENDNAIINNWNNVVDFNDDVYILGDISWYNSTETIKILQQLNGNKHRIIGNHDKKLLKNPKLRNEFVEICDYKEITFDDGTGLILCHYPIIAFKNHYYGWWHFYGHVHNNTWEDMLVEETIHKSVEISGVPCNAINVGCMKPWMGFYPKNFTEIIKGYNEYERRIKN